MKIYIGQLKNYVHLLLSEITAYLLLKILHYIS